MIHLNFVIIAKSWKTAYWALREEQFIAGLFMATKSVLEELHRNSIVVFISSRRLD